MLLQSDVINYTGAILLPGIGYQFLLLTRLYHKAYGN